jgi:translin
MNNLPEIAERVHLDFETRTRKRDQVLIQVRQVTRNSANAIRAIHRGELELAEQNLKLAKELIDGIRNNIGDFLDLYFEGYTQDAIKEYAEASITVAIISHIDIPDPEKLDVGFATYMRGLSEVPGELRRRCLDILRVGYSQEAEDLLKIMDEIYGVLVTMDYPDAITSGLRRQTDLVRGIVERTRADLTLSLREERLISGMQDLKKLLPGG